MYLVSLQLLYVVGTTHLKKETREGAEKWPFLFWRRGMSAEVTWRMLRGSVTGAGTPFADADLPSDI